MDRFGICFISLILISGLFSIEDKAFGGVSKSENEQVRTLNEQGVYYRMQGNQEEAIKSFAKAIEIDPNDAESYSHRGMSYGSSLVHKFDRAMIDFNKAIELNPDNGEYYYLRGLLYYQLEDFENAWKDIRQAESLKYDLSKAADILKDVRGRCAQYFNSRGLERYKNKEFDSAIPYYDKAIEARPDVAIFYENRANVYITKGEFDSAMNDLQKALAIDPSNGNVLHDLGKISIGKRDFDSAIAYFNKSIAVSSTLAKDGQSYNDRAVAYFYKKDYDKCWEDIHKAMQLGYKIHPQFLAELKKASGREK